MPQPWKSITMALMWGLWLVLSSVCAAENAASAQRIDPAATSTVLADNYTTECPRGTTYSYSFAGKTYLTWPGPGMSPQVCAIDEKTNEVSSVVQPKEFDFDGKWVYHNYPTIVVSKDGAAHVFMTRHNVNLIHLRSAPGGKLDQPWTMTEFSEGGAYPFPVVASDGTLYVFFAWTKDRSFRDIGRPLYFRRSTDHGNTWEAPVKCLEHAFDDLSELYVGSIRWEPAAGNYPERVNIVLTLAGKGGHNQCHKDIYYAYLDLRTHTVHDAAGTDLGACVTTAEAWAKLQVLDTGDSFSRPFAVNHTHNVVADAATGRPLVGYELYTQSQKSFTATFRYWTGAAWSAPVAIPEGNQICEMYREAEAMHCLVRNFKQAGAYSYRYDPIKNRLERKDVFVVDGLAIGDIRQTGNYGGYRPARFVFHEKFAEIGKVEPRFRVGLYRGK